ncbi:MAG TPA: tetratricopeptide repeat protein [Magnetovibrio sp.]
MKRLLALATLLMLFGAMPARADYEAGLKLVREAKYQQAYAAFLPMAESGHAPSQFSIALLYHLGRGMRQDLKKAYDWYKKAAMQEHPGSMNNLGMMYLNGEYVTQNRAVAFKLFEKASVEFAQAKDNLGQCYEHGWGVEQDIGQAVNFYQLAGDAGFFMGYYHAGEVFEKGYADEARDLDTAVEWYIKAAEKGLQKARTRLIELKRLPDDLRK